MSATKKKVSKSASSEEGSAAGGAGSPKAAPAANGVTDDRVVVRELKELYASKLLEIEQKTLFHKFHAPEMLPSEIASKPTVLLLGQYSVGKTTFIRHLIRTDYPGIHIGPEPTTDRFIAVVHGETEKVIKGNALTGVVDLPFSGLSTFGSGFLNKFEAAVVPAEILRDINIIDTPGVLSGEKQRVSRGYDFAQVSKWFAERSDLILLLFDAHKLDISDEFKSVMEELHPHEDKVRCVLNKADNLESTESLMRVYGALLWSMGKIFRGAEVTRIYVGSFSDEEIKHKDQFGSLFAKDNAALLDQLQELPGMCSMRKVNEMVKRIRLCVVHTCVLGHLRSKMPMLWGAEATQARLIKTLDTVFEEVKGQYHLSEGDFPNIDEFRAVLQRQDFYTFPPISRKVLNQLQEMLSNDIPRIISHVSGVAANDAHGDDVHLKGRTDGKFLNLFTFEEEDEKNQQNGNRVGNMMQSQQTMVLIIAGLVVVLAVMVASVMDNHVTFHVIMQSIANLIDNLKAELTRQQEQQPLAGADGVVE